jgi:hypothetical protein
MNDLSLSPVITKGTRTMTTATLDRPTFDYTTARLREFSVATRTDLAGRSQVAAIHYDGEPLRASKRFWHSLQLRFGFTPNIFRYFTHAEVFERISTVAANDEVRICIERPQDGGTGTLLAVTNPSTAVAEFGELERLLGRHDSEEVSYHNGVVRSTHTPRSASPFQIAGDHFQSKYVIDAPIDGFGRPAVYLSLLRQICANGAIAYAAAFRSRPGRRQCLVRPATGPGGVQQRRRLRRPARPVRVGDPKLGLGSRNAAALQGAHEAVPPGRLPQVDGAGRRWGGDLARSVPDLSAVPSNDRRPDPTVRPG